MAIKPVNGYDDPLVKRAQEAVISLAAAHVAVGQQYPESADARRTGSITATWVGDVLVLSADGGCADDLVDLLRASLLASPERAL